ncbi:MAG: alanine dehydrogenase [Chlorobiaceae bacterium]|nr:alanine dehydrogenase [Chlorobiaceae bacterium]
MNIGIPKEVKTRENRVSCTPAGVRHLVAGGHRVVVEQGAGEGSGFSNNQYERAGASIVDSAGKAWDNELVVKVKEPLEQEYGYFKRNQILFTYLHLASAPELTRELLAAGTTGLAYETVEDQGRLPLLAPMSEVAGKMSVIMGAYHLARHQGGEGRLLGGVPGVLPGKVVILGGGSAGINAARSAAGIGAAVTIMEIKQERLRELDLTLPPQVQTLYANEQHLDDLLAETDLLIGAVLVPGASAPKLLTRPMLRKMRQGAVVVDIAIDQGGCFETSRPTTHDDPVFVEEGVVHYCVANMPAAYPRTSTEALTGATLPYVRRIADLGLDSAMVMIPGLWGGLNTWNGHVVHKEVAQSLGLPLHEHPFA